METLPRLFRALTLAILVLLVLLGIPDDRAAEDGPLQVSLSEIPDQPDSTWFHLLRHGAEAPIHALIPGSPPPVTIYPLQRLRAERAAGLGIQAHQDVQLTLTTPAGLSEALSLGAGESGAFRLQPRQPGPARWVLAVDDGGQEPLGGWVEEARPLRILALSGPPSSESRMAIRALEEAGEEVESWIHLGRELWVGRESGPLPQEREAYADVDVIILFPGLELPTPVVDLLRQVVEEEGVGLLLAGAPPPSLTGEEVLRSSTLATGTGSTSPVSASSLSWALPPEISPLPPVDAQLHLHGSESPLTLDTAGRGRVGVLAIADTWRWRMEEEELEGHQRFWGSTVSWLAGGLVHDPIIQIAADRVRPGEKVRIQLLGQRDDGAPTHLEVTGPETEVTLALPSPTPQGPLHLQETFFVPFHPGEYTLQTDDAHAPAALLVLDREEPELDPGGRLARLALASPGGQIQTRPSALPDPERPLPWPLLLFGALALLLGGEWLIRRMGGRP